MDVCAIRVLPCIRWLNIFLARIRSSPGLPDEHTRQHGRQGEPGDGIDQVAVGEGDHRQPAARPAAGIGRRVGVDEIGRDRPQMAALRQGGQVAAVPQVVRLSEAKGAPSSLKA